MVPNGNALNLSGYLFYSFFLHFYGLSIHAKEYMYVYIRTCDGRKHNFFFFFPEVFPISFGKLGESFRWTLKQKLILTRLALIVSTCSAGAFLKFLGAHLQKCYCTSQ